MEKLVEVSEQEVQIDFSLNCKCRATVRLRSLVATCPVVFKVQTSSPHKFLVNPPSGLVPPLSHATFQLILKPQSTLPTHFPRSPSDRFLIKTALVPESTRPELLGSLFDSPSHDVRLSVAFVGPTLLRHAVSIGDVNAVKKIVKRQRSLVAELPAGEAHSLFRLAESTGIASLLVEAGLKTENNGSDGPKGNPHDRAGLANGWEELHLAAEFDRVEEIANLVECGGPLDCRDREGRTALMVAAEKGNEGSVRVLVGAGGDVDATSKDGRTGLCRAAANGDRRMVELLMELGADPTVGGLGCGGLPVDVARDKGFKEVVEILEQGEAVLTTARRGDSIHLERLLNRGAIVSWHDQYGLTPLHVAAIKGHKDTVTLLLEFRSELDCRDNEGHTPLHLAVEGGCISTVEVFVNRGADLNAKSKRGATPLYIAKVMGYDDIYNYLSGRGACPCDEFY